jgi:hypothetical protein
MVDYTGLTYSQLQMNLKATMHKNIVSNEGAQAGLYTMGDASGWKQHQQEGRWSALVCPRG